MAVYRVNMRFKDDNDADIRALNYLKKISDEESCSLNRAIINVINRYITSVSGVDTDEIVKKVSKAVREEINKYSLVLASQKQSNDEEDVDILFSFIEEIGL